MQKPEKSFLPENVEEISITRMYQIFLVEYIEIGRMNQFYYSKLSHKVETYSITWNFK